MSIGMVVKSNRIGIGINVKLINGSLTSLRKVLDKVERVDFDVVELPVHGLDVIVGGKIRRERLKEIKRILCDYPFTYSLHCPERLNLMNLENIEMEKRVFKSSIDFAYEIGARVLVYHPGRYRSEIKMLLKSSGEKSMEEKLKDLRKIEQEIVRCFIPLLKDAGVILAMENARPFLGERNYTYAEDIGKLVDQVKEIDHKNVGITLDFGHAYLYATYSDKDFLEEISMVRPYLRHIHIHDNFGYPCYFQEKDQNLLVAHGRGDMHMIPGWGRIPFQEAFRILKPVGCFVVLEVRPRYFEYISEGKSVLEILLKGIETGNTL